MKTGACPRALAPRHAHVTQIAPAVRRGLDVAKGALLWVIPDVFVVLIGTLAHWIIFRSKVGDDEAGLVTLYIFSRLVFMSALLARLCERLVAESAFSTRIAVGTAVLEELVFRGVFLLVFEIWLEKRGAANSFWKVRDGWLTHAAPAAVAAPSTHFIHLAGLRRQRLSKL